MLFGFVKKATPQRQAGGRRVASLLMSTTSSDPLVALGALPGVTDAVDSVRKAVDRVYGHRVMRRRSNEVTAEAALRGARGSAALSGADWNLEEVRRLHRLQR